MNASSVPKASNRPRTGFGWEASHSETAPESPPILPCSSAIATTAYLANTSRSTCSSSGFTVWKLSTRAEMPNSFSLRAASSMTAVTTPVPRERHAGRHAHHVRFGYAAVEETARRALLELVEQLVTDVAGQEHHARVGSAKPGHLVGESVPHRTIPSSRCAARTSSAVGMR